MVSTKVQRAVRAPVYGMPTFRHRRRRGRSEIGSRVGCLARSSGPGGTPARTDEGIHQNAWAVATPWQSWGVDRSGRSDFFSEK